MACGMQLCRSMPGLVENSLAMLEATRSTTRRAGFISSLLGLQALIAMKGRAGSWKAQTGSSGPMAYLSVRLRTFKFRHIFSMSCSLTRGGGSRLHGAVYDLPASLIN